MPRKPYQDVWRDGRCVEKGRRECADRFDLIASALSGASSVVDVGGWDGYFARRFAEAGVHATIVEPRAVPDLPAGVVHRREKVTAATDLGVHDAGLLLSVLHHMPDWQGVYESLRRSSRQVVVEAAVPDEMVGDLSPTLVETGGRIGPIVERIAADARQIGSTRGPNGPRRPIYLVENTWAGTVEAGLGRASAAMTNRDPGRWGALLGYVPAPGTLNVRVGAAGKSWVRHLPGGVQDSKAGGVNGPYWPVTANGIDGHVRTSRSRTTVEVVAAVNLRDALNLVDGATIELRIR